MAIPDRSRGGWAAQLVPGLELMSIPAAGREQRKSHDLLQGDESSSTCGSRGQALGGETENEG